MKTTILACLIACGLAAGSIAPGAAAADSPKSLRGDAGVAEADPATPVYPIKEGPRFDRAFRDQPPLIPHRVDKYEIDLKVNQCLRCHDWPNNAAERAPMVSVSHFVDRQGRKLDRLAGQRWFCTACHVPQADAKALVPNDFRPVQGQ